MFHDSAHFPTAVHPGFAGGAAARRIRAVRQRRSPFWLPLAVVASVIFVVVAQLQYAASGGGEVFGQLVGTNRSREVAFLVLGAMGAFLLLQRPARKKVPFWPILFPALVLAGYVYTSVLWSDDPSTTVKRAVVMTCIVAAGFGMGKSWDSVQYSWAIFILSSVFLVVSLCAELYYHAWMSNPEEYRFSGIFHPGRQAFNCGMLAMASLSLFFTKRRKVFLAVVAVAFAVIILTKARTGLAASTVAVGLLAWPYLSRRTIVVVALLGAFTAATLVTYVGATGTHVRVKSLATMGRDEESADPAKLTGRLPIWHQALGLFAEQPVLGYGYGAFWTEARLHDFARRNNWTIAHAHSAYIESLVNLGMIGFSLGLCIALITFVQSLRLSKIAGNFAARLVAGILTLAFVGGFSEMVFVGTGYEFMAIAMGIGLFAFRPAAPRSLGRNAARGRFRDETELHPRGHRSPLSVTEPTP